MNNGYLRLAQALSNNIQSNKLAWAKYKFETEPTIENTVALFIAMANCIGKN